MILERKKIFKILINFKGYRLKRFFKLISNEYLFLLQTESHDRHKGKCTIIYYFFKFSYKYIQSIKASDTCICGILSKLMKAPASRASVFKNVFV